MSPPLVASEAALAALRNKIDQKWAEAICADHGVNHDKAGRPIKPSSTRLLHLTRPESTAYDAVATAGPAQFRRIEQEAIPLPQAAARLEALISTRS